MNDTSIPSTSKSNSEQNDQRNILKVGKRKLCFEKWPNKMTKHNEDLGSKGCDERKQQYFVPINKNEKEDPFDLFFKSMALTVKRFSPHLKIRAKKAVFNIITELEIEHNNANT